MYSCAKTLEKKDVISWLDVNILLSIWCYHLTGWKHSPSENSGVVIWLDNNDIVIIWLDINNSGIIWMDATATRKRCSVRPCRIILYLANQSISQ
jgi:hypothetical protein